jgi:hypothetical protein
MLPGPRKELDPTAKYAKVAKTSHMVLKSLALSASLAVQFCQQ